MAAARMEEDMEVDDPPQTGIFKFITSVSVKAHMCVYYAQKFHSVCQNDAVFLPVMAVNLYTIFAYFL